MLDFLLMAIVASAPAPPPPATEAAPSSDTDAGPEPTEGPEPTAGDAAADADAAPADDGAGDGGVTYYQFSGLGIDGELRTPALLQFLSRIGGEFETVGIPHRSFMPELRQTVMEDAL